MDDSASRAELVPAVSSEVLRRRHETYLTEHYLASHITAVNVALAIAGLSAVSLLATIRASSGYISVLCVLWLASILSVAAAYSGTMIGSIMLPAHVPGVRDLLLPLLLGLSEFLLFAVLAYKVTGLARGYVLPAWWFAFMVFGVAVFASVRRARRLIAAGAYSAEARLVRREYVDRMIVDLRATKAILVIGILGFTFQVCYGRLHTGWLAAFTPNQVNLVLAVLVLGMLAAGLREHRTSAALLRANLARLSIRQHETSLVRHSSRPGRTQVRRPSVSLPVVGSSDATSRDRQSTATLPVGELRVPALALAALGGAAVAATVLTVASKIRASGPGRT